MITYQNWQLFVSVLIYFGIKIFCFATTMYRQSALTSIPERNEVEEVTEKKWVPKKKHEVLKAKYKCLKKLFQVYDASVIGMLPEPHTEYQYANDTPRRRQKRSYRTKTDACAGTSEISGGDYQSDCDKSDIDRKECSKYIATAVIRDLKISCSTQFENNSSTNLETAKLDHKSNESISKLKNQTELESNDSQSVTDSNVILNVRPAHPVPYLILNEKRKLTRFQCFLQRVLGIRRDTYVPPNASASDSLRERRRRRGMRFRKIHRAKKSKSESDMGSPAILSCVQSAQRSCLMDTTPRQCPIIGCNMISYGIINYNDHLNLCHLKDSKYICHYCHAGFKREIEKIAHENEHIGMNRLGTDLLKLTEQCKVASNSNTQTEPVKEDEKLKKIVSFFDKISNPDDLIEQIRNNRSSSDVTVAQTYNNCSTSDDTVARNNNSQLSSNSDVITHVNRNHATYCINTDSDKTDSCVKSMSALQTTVSSSKTAKSSCDCCAKHLRCRSQRSLPVELEHPIQAKLNTCDFSVKSRDGCDKSRDTRDLVSHDGRLNVLSIVSSKELTPYTCLTTPCFCEDTLTVCTALGQSSETLTCDPSTNIIYSNTSMESSRKPSMVESFVKKVFSYRWEPETKIIRV